MAQPGSLVSWVIDWSLRNRFLVACGMLLIVAWGIWAVRHTPVDAIPDLSENQVIVFADWPGRSPQEVEDQVTYPLSVNLQGLAGVKEVRASSMFGFALLTVIFDDNIDNYFARTQGARAAQFPADAASRRRRAATRTGRHRLGLGLSILPQSRSTLAAGGNQRPPWAAMTWEHCARCRTGSFATSLPRSGVAEVGSIGGFVRQYQVDVDSGKMRTGGREPARSDGGRGGEQHQCRRQGDRGERDGVRRARHWIGEQSGRSPTDCGAFARRTPIYLEDIAEISIGGDFRRGALDVDGREVVGGVVVMRTGENAMQVIQRVKEKNRADRAEPAARRDHRSFLRPQRSDRADHRNAQARACRGDSAGHAGPHHLSLALPQHPDRHASAADLDPDFLHPHAGFGITSNIMSLSGIAIAIGVLVDAGIVMTENVIRHCEAAEKARCRHQTATWKSFGGPPNKWGARSSSPWSSSFWRFSPSSR